MNTPLRAATLSSIARIGSNNASYYTHLLALLSTFASKLLKRKSRVHDYTCREYGADYIFEADEQGTRGYMTGQGRGVREGDYLILKSNLGTEYYQVEQIDYYANPQRLWIALLYKANPPA